MGELRRTGWRGTTLETAFSGRDNAFNLIRLFLALAVLFGHSRILGYNVHANPGNIPIDIGGLAVSSFFALSGFLISRRSSLLRYTWHRVLRIYPGLWVCLIVTAFVAAPLNWLKVHGTLDGFFSAPNGPFDYVLNNWTTEMGQYAVSGMPDGVPYKFAFDGSLWTLKYELTCYFIVGILAVVGVLRRARVLVLLSTLALWAVIVYDNLHDHTRIGPLVDGRATPDLPIFGSYTLFYAVMFGMFFAFGTLADLYHKIIPVNDVLGVASGVIVLIAMYLHLDVLGAAAPAMVYLLLWLSIRLPKPLRKIGLRNDYSYGVYIYAFVVQQVLAAYGVPKYGLLVYLLSSIALTLMVAAVSWHLVEKPAMRLKHWTPRFGRRADREQPTPQTTCRQRLVRRCTIRRPRHPATPRPPTPRPRARGRRTNRRPRPSTGPPTWRAGLVLEAQVVQVDAVLPVPLTVAEIDRERDAGQRVVACRVQAADGFDVARRGRDGQLPQPPPARLVGHVTKQGAADPLAPAARGHHHRLHLTAATVEDQPDQPDDADTRGVGDPHAGQVESGEVLLERGARVGSGVRTGPPRTRVEPAVLLDQLDPELPAVAMVRRAIGANRHRRRIWRTHHDLGHILTTWLSIRPPRRVIRSSLLRLPQKRHPHGVIAPGGDRRHPFPAASGSPAGLSWIRRDTRSRSGGY